MKPIAGYEGLYSIDKEGNVYSHRRKKFLKPYLAYPKSSGLKYREVRLCKDGVKKCKRLHRLLATAFIENPNNLPFVDHIDMDAGNNSLSNLRWCDGRGNQANKNKTNYKRKMTSKYKGVAYAKHRNDSNKWEVYLSSGSKSYRGGAFSTEIEAAKQYDKLAKELYGEFARTNF